MINKFTWKLSIIISFHLDVDIPVPKVSVVAPITMQSMSLIM